MICPLPLPSSPRAHQGCPQPSATPHAGKRAMRTQYSKKSIISSVSVTYFQCTIYITDFFCGVFTHISLYFLTFPCIYQWIWQWSPPSKNINLWWCFACRWSARELFKGNHKEIMVISFALRDFFCVEKSQVRNATPWRKVPETWKMHIIFLGIFWESARER